MADILITMAADIEGLRKDLMSLKSDVESIAGVTQKADRAMSNFGTSVKQALGVMAAGQAFNQIISGLSQVERKAGDVDAAFQAFGGESFGGKSPLVFSRAFANMAAFGSGGLTRALTDEAKRSFSTSIESTEQ